jgi:hypothetical protein
VLSTSAMKARAANAAAAGLVVEVAIADRGFERRNFGEETICGEILASSLFPFSGSALLIGGSG